MAADEMLLAEADYKFTNEGFHHGDPLGLEGRVRQPPHTCVGGWIDIGEGGYRTDAARGQETSRFGTRRLDRRKRVRGGEQFRQFENLAYILMMRNDPIFDQRTIEDWGGAARLCEKSV